MIIGIIREYPIQELTFNCEEIDENGLCLERCYLTDIKEYIITEYWEKEEGSNEAPVVNRKKTLKKHLQVQLGKFNIKLYRTIRNKPVHDDMVDATQLIFDMIHSKVGIFIGNKGKEEVYIAQNMKITPKKPKKKYKKPQFNKYGSINLQCKPNKKEYNKLITLLKE